MNLMYIDCSMGAAGDMLTGALLELLPKPDEFIEKLNALGIPGVKTVKSASTKCGVVGTYVSVSVNGEEEHDHEHHHHEHHHDGHHHHHHTGIHDIEHIVNDLPVKEKIKSDIMAVYGLIAEAESHAHGVPVKEIHFHEVGMMDAVADITAVCLLMDELAPSKVIASPVNVGGGMVRCAHGILPVPAPATAYILRDVPVFSGEIKSELCTPTGAALLKYFVSEFGSMPVMRPEKIGYGMGKKDFEAANCVRVMLGSSEEKKDTVTELKCNLDDMTPEKIGFAMQVLLDAGALEVYTESVGMKKNRPGTMICVLCDNEDKEKMVKLLFKHTTTIGIRENICRRYALERKIITVATEYGDVRKKISSGYGTVKEKYEYDDIARIAKERNISIEDAEKDCRL